ncbi:sugar phosphate isomerase/epimerase family protein [Paenibacillus solisilvae]|uniref:Sugar phosphate isomerase/epimerase family protein n=1 Tax=Paenibacillus solisilvae TaxID=2486751 RepID=A0ABW0VXK5_9BACL
MFKGISDWAFREAASGEAIIRMASRMGFDGVEFNVYEEDAPISLKRSLAEFKQLAEAATDCGVLLPSLSTSLHNAYSLTSNNKIIRQKGIDLGKRMIEIASALGAKTILVVPGNVDAEIPYDRAYASAQEALLLLAPEASSAGIAIGVENVWNGFLLSPLEFAVFLDELNEPAIRAYFDVGNAMNAGYPEQWIRLLGTRLAGVHMKDFRPEAGKGHQVVPFFYGDVNWAAVMDALRCVNYEGFLIATPPSRSGSPERHMRNVSDDIGEIMEL